MKRKIIGILVCTLLISTLVFTVVGNEENKSNSIYDITTRQELDFGDAPEGSIAYPSLGVFGGFPTCINCGPSLWVQHTNFGAWFGPVVDFEIEGNGGLCPLFPPYDKDETFQDNDAGLIMPEPFTIDGSLNVVPIPGYTGTPLGIIGQTAVWGVDVDIWVHNTMPGHEPYLPAYVNVLIDWNQNGFWSDIPAEHVLVNFIVPPLYIGPLSVLGPPNFVIGPKSGFVWARFSITEYPVQSPWPGDGEFEDGESEDYLLLVEEPHQPVPDLECNGSLTWTNVKPGETVTGSFDVGNVGDPGSLLDWEVSNNPTWGSWTFTPPSGNGLAAGSWVTINVAVVSPNPRSKKPISGTQYTGVIEVRNKNDHSDNCTIPVSLTTPKSRTSIDPILLNLLQRFFKQYPVLHWILNQK